MTFEYPAFIEVNDELVSSKDLIDKGLASLEDLRNLPTIGKRRAYLKRVAKHVVAARKNAKHAAKQIGWQ